MFENAFLKAASELDNAISLGSLFHNRPCIEGILVVIPNLSTNGQRIVVWHLREGLACILFYAA